MGTAISTSAKLSRWAMILLVMLLGLTPDAPAADLTATSRPTAVSPDLPLAVAGSWQTLYSPFESLLGSRRRMIQLATVGVCIALYILMRHR